jgi:hypothetical protein
VQLHFSLSIDAQTEYFGMAHFEDIQHAKKEAEVALFAFMTDFMSNRGELTAWTEAGGKRKTLFVVRYD